MNRRSFFPALVGALVAPFIAKKVAADPARSAEIQRDLEAFKKTPHLTYHRSTLPDSWDIYWVKMEEDPENPWLMRPVRQ